MPKTNFTMLLLFLAVVLTGLPLLWTAFDTHIPDWMHIGLLSNNWASYGTWLQGSLTPVVVGFAIWSFNKQQRAIQRQIDTQLRANENQIESNKALIAANEMAEKYHFIDRMDRFTLMLNRLALHSLPTEVVSAIVRDHFKTPSAYDAISSASMVGLEQFIKFVQNPVNKTPPAISALQQGEIYRQLSSEINVFVKRAERYRVAGLIDYRILTVAQFTTENPPKPSSEVAAPASQSKAN